MFLKTTKKNNYKIREGAGKRRTKNKGKQLWRRKTKDRKKEQTAVEQENEAQTTRANSCGAGKRRTNIKSKQLWRGRTRDNKPEHTSVQPKKQQHMFTRMTTYAYASLWQNHPHVLAMEQFFNNFLNTRT